MVVQGSIKVMHSAVNRGDVGSIPSPGDMKGDNMPGVVYYINLDEEVKELSNFSRHPVEVDGVLYMTSEHYFQAAKFFETEPEWAKAIASTRWPSEAFKMGKDRSHKIDPNWDTSSALYHMERVLFEKVKQHKVIYDKLLATGNAYIVERADWDDIWGDGKNRVGKNQLGRLWMKVRNELKKAGE